MPDRLLEADEALHTLVQELQKFKSASVQLALAGDNVGKLTQSIEKLISLSTDIADAGQQQLDRTSQLAADTDLRLKQLADDQQAFVRATEGKLKNEVIPGINRVGGLAKLIRTLVVISLLMIAANLALGYWIVQLLMSQQ